MNLKNYITAIALCCTISGLQGYEVSASKVSPEEQAILEEDFEAYGVKIPKNHYKRVEKFDNDEKFRDEVFLNKHWIGLCDFYIESKHAVLKEKFPDHDMVPFLNAFENPRTRQSFCYTDYCIKKKCNIF